MLFTLQKRHAILIKTKLNFFKHQIPSILSSWLLSMMASIELEVKMMYKLASRSCLQPLFALCIKYSLFCSKVVTDSVCQFASRLDFHFSNWLYISQEYKKAVHRLGSSSFGDQTSSWQVDYSEMIFPRRLW